MFVRELGLLWVGLEMERHGWGWVRLLYEWNVYINFDLYIYNIMYEGVCPNVINILS